MQGSPEMTSIPSPTLDHDPSVGAIAARLLPSAINAARAAGLLTLEWFRPGEGTSADIKQDGSPVTAADVAAEALILAALRKSAPNVPIIAEEGQANGSGDTLSESHSRLFWLVDPVDGTKEFVAGRRSYTVNIGLVWDRVPIMGVIDQPALGRTYWGIVGLGAFRRDPSQKTLVERIRVRRAPSEGLTVVASRSHDPERELRRFLAGRKVRNTINVGSSLKFCTVAEGAADFYPRLGPTSEWDTAAGHAIVVAAGARVRTIDGGPFEYRKPGWRNGGFVVDVPAENT